MSSAESDLTEGQQARLLADLIHLPFETIQAYVRKEIRDPAESMRVEDHLFDCDQCLEHYNALFDTESPYKAAFDAFEPRLTQALQDPEKRRLERALEHLASLQGAVAERLLRWRESLLATEARYGAALSALLQPNVQESSLRVLDALSAPGLQSATAGSVKGVTRDPVGRRRLVIVAGEWLDVEVAIEPESIRLEFMGWSEPEPPLALLLSEEEVEGEAEGRLPDSIVSQAEGEFSLRFENVPLGSYLLSIAPTLTKA